jgi:putative ABC transport system permease protein
VGWYWVQLGDPGDAVRVSAAIDEAFANSPWETRTQSESAFAASFVKQMGNVEFLILAIGAIVFFTLLLVTGNTMAIAVRERTGEHAILKAIGWSDGRVLRLVLAESLVVAVLDGAAGLGLAVWLIATKDLAQGMVLLYLPGAAVAAGGALAFATGVLAGLLPALGAMRLTVVDGLRRA